jgi:hypothetical protein
VWRQPIRIVNFMRPNGNEYWYKGWVGVGVWQGQVRVGALIRLVSVDTHI